MYKNSRKKKRKNFYYYRCLKCNKTINYAELENKVINKLLNLNELTELDKEKIKIENNQNNIDFLKKENNKLIKMRKNYIRLFATEDITKEEYDLYIMEIKEKQLLFTKEIEKIETSINNIIDNEKQSKILKTLHEIIENMEAEDREDIQKLFKVLIKDIFINDFENIEVSINLNI